MIAAEQLKGSSVVRGPPAARWTARLAWSAWTLAMLIVAIGLVFQFLSRDAPIEDPLVFRGFDAVLAVPFATVGAVLGARRPANPVGWLFMAIGVVSAMTFATHAYGVHALYTMAGTVPGGEVLMWLSEIGGAAVGYAQVAAYLLFPDGRLPSPRWRPVVPLLVGGALVKLASVALAPGPLWSFAQLENPFGVGGTAGEWLLMALTAGEVLYGLALVGAIASLMIRYRQAAAAERQQLKWIAFAGTFVAIGAVAFVLTGSERGTGPLSRFTGIVLLVAVILVPIATGMAILRYRLFEIDRIIRRTALYAVLTALLGGTYVGLVFLLGLAVNPAGGSDLVVAGSVLVVAALFRPLRHRAQTIIDRRFDRARYDAARIMDSFSATLRHQVDLEAVGGQLLAVAQESMHPQHMSLWLRDGSPGADIGTAGWVSQGPGQSRGSGRPSPASSATRTRTSVSS